MSEANSKYFFTPEEKDVFIDFVREHEILYKGKHKGSRYFKEKNRLWKQIGSRINKDPEICKKKWYMLRDGFWRYMSKSADKNPVEMRDNQKSLMFLLETATETTHGTMAEEMPVDCVDVKVQFDETAAALSYLQNVASASNNFTHFIGTTQAHTVNGDPLIAYEHMADGRIVQSKSCQTDAEPDNLDVFFSSLANTMRTFPRVEIAKLKLEMSQMVGRKEIELNSTLHLAHLNQLS